MLSAVSVGGTFSHDVMLPRMTLLKPMMTFLKLGIHALKKAVNRKSAGVNSHAVLAMKWLEFQGHTYIALYITHLYYMVLKKSDPKSS